MKKRKNKAAVAADCAGRHIRIVVVVDFQNDFITGPLGTKEARDLVPYMTDKIRDAISSTDDTVLVLTYDTHGEDYLDTVEGKNLPIKHCIKGTDGWKYPDAIQKMIDDALESQVPGDEGSCTVYTIEKDTFPSLELGKEISDTVAYNMQEGMDTIDEIELSGLVTDMCVIGNAVMAKAAAPNVRITVDSKGTEGTSPEAKQKALDVMKGLQIEIK